MRNFEIARGSALECVANQDVLVVGKALELTESREVKVELDRIVALPCRLGAEGFRVKAEQAQYGPSRSDPDPDPDSDFDPDDTAPCAAFSGRLGRD